MKELKDNSNWKRGQDFLGVRYPILSGAMTWISNAGLVTAVSSAGGLGTLAGGNMPADLLENEMDTLQQANIHFALNLITIAPQYQAHLELAVARKIPVIVFAGSFPRREEIRRAKASGAKAVCFASTVSIARRMIDYGADALILEGSEAGGHIGHVSTVVLIQQVLFRFPGVPIFIAGGIATGRMIAHLFLMGAAGVQMGTIFAMAQESPAHVHFKDRFRRARAREAVATPQYDSSLPVVSVRALKNQGMEEFGKLQLSLLEKLKQNRLSRIQAQYEVESYWHGALRRAVQDGDIAKGSLMAGQSVGLVTESKTIPDIFNDLIRDAEQEYAAVFRQFS